MTDASQGMRMRLEHFVVATGVALTAVLLGRVAQSLTVVAVLVILLLLLRWQQSEQPDFNQRPHADSGLWLSLLLPFSLLTAGNSYEHGDVYTFAEVVCSQALVLSLAVVFKITNIFIYALSTVWTTTLLVTATSVSFPWSAAAAVTTAGTFSYLVTSLPAYSPKSFTHGELLLVCQGITTFVVVSGCSLACNIIYRDRCDLKCSASAGFLQAGLFSLALFVAAVTKIQALQKPTGFYVGLFTSAILLVYPLCSVMVNGEPLSWLAYHCFSSYTRLCLMVSWIVMLVIAGLFVYWYTTNYSESSTVVRKVFHAAIVSVFLPGVILDPDLMYLACGAILGVFVLLEVFRTLSIPPVGPCIQNVFAMFVDEKDAGAFILTPTYLFIGCAASLLLFPGRFGDPEKMPVLLSGTVALGIGDTAASVVGSKLGKHQWPGTSKTVEGTLAAIVAQFGFYFPLLFVAVPTVWHLNTLLLIVVLCLDSYLEAFTTQVDNLALPVFVYPMMTALYALE
ncbi:dolichol kinase [Dermacentor andersoni]|uniref:dolichol kinase n=1 Tax=Dermacentor andersoni TaxID=34620 RepID=UPI002155F908|nr:dolichol kinase-like [Dermacentor andersoni]